MRRALLVRIDALEIYEWWQVNKRSKKLDVLVCVVLDDASDTRKGEHAHRCLPLTWVMFNNNPKSFPVYEYERSG